MIQIGIRLHDVNTEGSEAAKSLEGRLATARAEGFTCAHLALKKVLPGLTFDPAALTEGLAAYVRRAFAAEQLDIAVLGCYLNLAHPDPAQLAAIKAQYTAHLRVASIMGAGMVGTETGAPNAAYKLDAQTHTDAAFKALLYSLEDVVAEAERRGVTLAIEPVWNHIVYTPQRALEAIRSIGSPNLRIILDPVNLLSVENVDRRDEVFAEAIDLLGEHVAMVHLKDYRREGDKLVSIAAGTGEMDYTRILRYLKQHKPYIQATLENTDNSTAVASREHIEAIYQSA